MRVSIELSQTYKKSKPEVFVKSDKSVRSVKSAMSFRLLFTNETDRHILLTDLYWYSLALSLNLMLWRLEFCDSCWQRYQSILASSYVVSGAENVADATLDFTSLSPPSGPRILAHDLVNTPIFLGQLSPHSPGDQLQRRTHKCNIFQGWVRFSEFLLCSRSPLCFLRSQST